jgi:hypothetical protein
MTLPLPLAYQQSGAPVQPAASEPPESKEKSGKKEIGSTVTKIGEWFAEKKYTLSHRADGSLSFIGELGEIFTVGDDDAAYVRNNFILATGISIFIMVTIFAVLTASGYIPLITLPFLLAPLAGAEMVVMASTHFAADVISSVAYEKGKAIAYAKHRNQSGGRDIVESEDDTELEGAERSEENGTPEMESLAGDAAPASDETNQAEESAAGDATSATDVAEEPSGGATADAAESVTLRERIFGRRMPNIGLMLFHVNAFIRIAKLSGVNVDSIKTPKEHTAQAWFECMCDLAGAIEATRKTSDDGGSESTEFLEKKHAKFLLAHAKKLTAAAKGGGWKNVAARGGRRLKSAIDNGTVGAGTAKTKREAAEARSAERRQRMTDAISAVGTTIGRAFGRKRSESEPEN